MKRSEMSRGEGPKRKTELRRSGSLSAGGKRPDTREAAGDARKAGAQRSRPRVTFSAVVPASRHRCALCDLHGRPPKRATTWHHVLPQQHLRRWAGSYRVARGLSQAEGDIVLRRLLHDERNLMALCATCHLGVEHKQRRARLRLWLEDIPAAAWVFALELGESALARLERNYPPTPKETR